MNFYYQQQRTIALRWHDHRCIVCGRPLDTTFDAHHLLVRKGEIRDRHRHAALDNAINLAPCHNGRCHQGLHGGGKRAACMRQYEVLGRGDVWDGYEIAMDWCQKVLHRTEPDIPAPEGDGYEL